MNSMEHTAVKKLKLANGSEWNFVPTGDTVGVVEKAASLLGLSNGSPRSGTNIIFVLGDPRVQNKAAPGIDQYPELHHLPANGWKPLYLGEIRLWTHSVVSDVLCEVNGLAGNIHEVTRLYLSLLPLYNQVVYSGGLPFHAAMIEHAGKCVLITATSGTGKSTCCRRVPDPWKPLCDDETVLVRTGREYRAHPFPTWSNYLSGRTEIPCNVQQSLPPAGIFFLEQAQIDQVLPVKNSMAAHALFNSAKHVYYKFNIYLTKDELYNLNRKLFENACELSQSVPIFKLQASLGGQFWEEMDKVLQ